LPRAEAGERCGDNLGAAVPGLSVLGGVDEKCCCCMPREAHHHKSFEIPSPITYPAARATVVAAICYTFADLHHSYDELLSALIPDFLSSIEDQDLTVRRLAIFALNSAARNNRNLSGIT